MNPIYELLTTHQYDVWDVPTQFQIRNEILALGIPGLVDVQFNLKRSEAKVTPVFATEQDYTWYQLKYVNSL
jgi:hypothetical protein